MARKIPLHDAINEYEAHLRARQQADNTVKNKVQCLRRAEQVWGNIQPSSLRPHHVDRLFAEGGWAPRTQNLYLGNVRQFFAWCRNNGYMDRDFDPTFGWGNAKVPREERLRVPVDQFYPLLDSLEHPRDRYALALGLFLFPRGSEIQTLTIGDVDLNNLEISLYRHKGKDADRMPIGEELRVETVRWLNWYRADQGGLQPHWFLVPAKNPDLWTWVDGKLTPTGVLSHLRPDRKMSHPYRVAQRALERLGYDTKGEGEHTLRRSGARALADRLRSDGHDSALMTVASFLGHSDIRITQHYIGWNQERDRRNKEFKGQPMFPGIQQESGLHVVREVGHG